MQESFPPEHGCELLGDSFEQLLYGRRVSYERRRHFQTHRWDITNGCFDVIRDPFHEVAAVLILDCQHLLVHLLHRHPA